MADFNLEMVPVGKPVAAISSRNLFEEALAAEKADPDLAKLARSVHGQESGEGVNPRTSHAGARGNMQILPGTFAENADRDWNIDNPEHNMRAGIRYLRRMRELGGGDHHLAAIGYYGGPNAINAAKKGKAFRDPLNPNAPDTFQYANQVTARAGLNKPAIPTMELDDSFQLEPIAPKKEEKSIPRNIYENLLGTGLGLVDFIGGIPGAVMGSSIGAADALSGGNRPTVAREAAGELMHNWLPTNIYQNATGKEMLGKDTRMYRNVMGIPEAIGKVIEFAGKGIGEISKVFGTSETISKEISAGTELGIMAVLLGVGGGKPIGKMSPSQIRTEYQKFHKENIEGKRYTPPTTEEQQRIQDSYKQQREQEALGNKEVDTTKYNQMELPMEESPLPTRPPYNVLPPERIAELEKELNPPTDQRIPGQGELFTTERPYGQGELIQGRPVTTEGASTPGLRNRPTPDDVTLPANDMLVGDPIARQGSPYEMTGEPVANKLPSSLDEPIPYTRPTTPVGRLSRQAGFIGFNRTARNQGIVPALIKYTKDFAQDLRPITEIAKEMMDSGIKDVGDFSKAMYRMAVPRQIAILSQNKLIKSAVDHIQKIELMATQRYKNLIEGEGYTNTIRGFPKQVPTNEGGLTLFRKTYKSGGLKELAEMKSIWLDNIGKGKLTRESFKTDRQWATYSAMRKGLDKIRDDVNKARALIKKDPIDFIDNYFPSMRSGDYKVTNKKGDFSEWVATRSQAKKVQAEMQKRFPNEEFKWESIDRKGDPYNQGNIVEAFDKAGNIAMKQGNPALAREFFKIYGELQGKQGFGRHGAHRTGVGGFMGTREGKRGLIDMEAAYDQYAKGAYRYISNIEKTIKQSEMNALGPEVRGKFKKSIELANDLFNMSKGGRREDILRTYAETIGNLSGRGKSAVDRYLQNVSAIALPYMLLTGKQVIANMTQPIVNISALSKMKATGEIQVSPVTAMIEGYLNVIKPDAQAIEAVNWATKKGILDPTITSLMELKGEGSSISKSKRIMEGVRALPAWMEHELVRLPSLLIYEKALRDTIKDPAARYEAAAAQMDHRMVNYGHSNTPLLYHDLGLAGDVVRPLKQYSHNIWGQLFEYMDFAKDTGKIAPLGYFFGQTFTVAGMKGLAFVPEITAAIVLYNFLNKDDVPTPEMMMHNAELHNALIYGGLSTALGHDVSASVAHPSVPLPDAIPTVFAADKLWDIYSYVRAYFSGSVTDAHRMKAALAITPNAGHGAIENWFSSNGYVPNPNNDMAGIYKRNESEKFWTNAWNMRSLDEAKERAFVNGAKQLLKWDMEQKKEATGAIADKLINKEPIPQHLIDQYIKEGGSQQGLLTAARKRAMDRERTSREILSGSRASMSPGQAHKLDRLNANIPPPKDTTVTQELDLSGDIEMVPVPSGGFQKMGTIDQRSLNRKDQTHNMPIGRAGSPGTSDNIPIVKKWESRPMTIDRKGYYSGQRWI